MVNKYRFFPSLILRSPALPVDILNNTEDFIAGSAGNKNFMEGLYIANPQMHKLCLELLSGSINDLAKKKRITDTVSNYLNRACTNPTPFGYFAGISVVKWKDNIKAPIITSASKPHIRLDMGTLDKLLSFLKAIPFVKTNALCFPNNTIYNAGSQSRYFEISNAGNKQVYEISAFENSDVIDVILRFGLPGKSISEIIDHLLSSFGDLYTQSELTDFVFELLDAQILVSELDINLTGEDPIARISLIMQRIYDGQVNNAPLQIVDELKSIISGINQQPETLQLMTARLHSLLLENGILVEEKSLLQVDLYTNLISNELNQNIQDQLSGAIHVITYFKQNIQKPRLESFKSNFIKRYGDTAVPLLQALDSETGIGFGNFRYQSNNLLFDETVVLKGPAANEYSNHSAGLSILYKKMLSAIKADDFTVFLKKQDFDKFPEPTHQLARTFQILFSVLDLENGLIHLHTAGHTSAASLLGRFGSGNVEVNTLLREISETELQQTEGKILAEIIHVPEARMGNLSYRPAIGNYEIPILNLSVLPAEQQILLEDIYVTVINSRIVLLSKKHGTEIVPKLTSAHNYNKDSIAAYQFLSELQYQDIIPSLNFNLGDMEMAAKFLPRIQFEKVIISRAKWILDQDDIKILIQSQESKNAYLKKLKIPRLTHYFYDSTEFFLDWLNPGLFNSFLNAASKVKKITIFEFPLNADSPAVINENSQAFVNQFIAPVQNLSYLDWKIDGQYIKRLLSSTAEKEKFHPGSEWIYIKVYTGMSSGDQVLKVVANLVDELYKKKLLKKFFFIRYNDPDFHLRFRFLCNEPSVSMVTQRIYQSLEPLQESNLVWKTEQDTYQRELTRYGNANIAFAESIFECSSLFWLNFIKLFGSNKDFYLPAFFLISADYLLYGLGLTMQEKMKVMSEMKLSYEREFKVDENKELQKLVNNKEKEVRKQFEFFMNGDFSAIINHAEQNILNVILDTLRSKVEECRTKTPVAQNELFHIIYSLIHMHAIRCFKTRPRENELFCYLVISSHYKKHIYSQAND